MTDGLWLSPGWCLITIHVVGLASAWLARQSQGTPRQSPCQFAFLASLVIVGPATAASFFMGPGPFLLAGSTFATMVLTATWEFSDTVRAQPSS